MALGILEMIVLIVFIKAAADVVKTALRNRPGGFQPSSRRARVTEAPLEDALRQIREEMAQLRQSSHDVILSFDSTLQRLEARVQHLERVALGRGETKGTLPPAADRIEVTDRAPGDEKRSTVPRRTPPRRNRGAREETRCDERS